MSSVVIIQARTNSGRLPAKVLLPIGGLPVAVLAALRAGNTGRQILLAISNQDSDDLLAEVLNTHSIACFRGSLNNTLLRFVDALTGYPDDTIVFRLTADNVIPDGRLLDEMECDFLARGLEYMACNGANSGVPYGVSAEVTRLRHLRCALLDSPNDNDIEHVTPAIIKKFGAAYFQKYLNRNMGAYRCTIDCLDDYLSVAKLFSGVSDPIGVSALDLMEKLQGQPNQPFRLKNDIGNKLVFGTAQLGLNYGITNSGGRPSLEASASLLKTAIVNGILTFDTARAYGESEEVIGRLMSSGWQGRARIVTKLEPLPSLPSNADAATCDAFVDSSVFKSLSALGVKHIDSILLHRAVHLHEFGGGVWRRLLEHKRNGLINTLGISVQTEDELLMALEVEDVGHIQLPFNILDWRWENAIKKIIVARKQRQLTVHVRSVYLQGLLMSEDDLHWTKANVHNSDKVLSWLVQTVQNTNRSSIRDLCIAYVNGLNWIDGIVLGMESMQQLLDNLQLIDLPPLSIAEIEQVNLTRPIISALALNPAMWKKDLT